jgi:hypothetical protein
MKAALMQTHFLFIVLSLSLILADCSFIGNAFTHHLTSTQRECSDISGNIAHSGSVCFEDEVFMNDIKVKPTIFLGCIELVPNLTVNFKSHYITSIWQPPKFS